MAARELVIEDASGHRYDGCDRCREHNRRWQKQRRAMGLPDPNDERHGTLSGYRCYGCKCDRCKAADREHRARRR